MRFCVMYFSLVELFLTPIFTFLGFLRGFSNPIIPIILISLLLGIAIGIKYFFITSEIQVVKYLRKPGLHISLLLILACLLLICSEYFNWVPVALLFIYSLWVGGSIAYLASKLPPSRQSYKSAFFKGFLIVFVFPTISGPRLGEAAIIYTVIFSFFVVCIVIGIALAFILLLFRILSKRPAVSVSL